METRSITGGLRVADLPEDADGPRHELDDGTLHVTPLGDLRHQCVVTALTALLAQVAPPDLSVLAGANVYADDATLVVPDVVVLTRAALDRGGLGVHPRDVRLVAEVLSPSTARVDRTLRRELMQAWDVPAYWLVDLDARRVERHGADPRPAWTTELDEDRLLGGRAGTATTGAVRPPAG